MSINFETTRRKLLAGIGATAFLPYSHLLMAAENKMRGALMILSTPYTDQDEVDYEDLAKEVAFCAQCGVCRVWFGHRIQVSSAT